MLHVEHLFCSTKLWETKKRSNGTTCGMGSSEPLVRKLYKASKKPKQKIRTNLSSVLAFRNQHLHDVAFMNEI